MTLQAELQRNFPGLIITSSHNWHEPGDGEVMAGADSSDLKPCDALTSVSKELNPIPRFKETANLGRIPGRSVPTAEIWKLVRR